MIDHEREGFACLARFTADGRELVRAIGHFASAGRFDMFPELLRIALRCGVIRAAVELRERLGLSLDDPAFVRWFHEHGALWFDIYEDERTARVLPEDAALHRALAKDYGSIVAWANSDGNLSVERLALLRKLAAGEEPVVAVSRDATDIDECFRGYCQREGIVILRTLQAGRRGLNRRNWVYSAIDADGIVKIFKQVQVRDDNRLGTFPTEPAIYARLGANARLPRCYGTVAVGQNVVFFKMSVCFGTSLAEHACLDNLLTTDEVCDTVGQLASVLAGFHAAGVLHLDLRPENAVLGADGAKLIDFNVSRLAANGEIDTFPFDPRYAAPETTLRFRASAATDVFQLGLIFHLLLTGEHPFADDNELPDDRAAGLERFGLANALMPYERRLYEEYGDTRLAIVVRMLDKDPALRPTMAEVASLLGPGQSRSVRRHGGALLPPREKNCVLFPARMGIPHHGHIEFIARLIDLGFHPVISLQRTYTLTERDPLPKWIVMKMVAQSLVDRGFRAEDLSFCLTPFFETDQETRMHFAMMPGFDDVVAVASGNTDVPRLFPGLPVIDQRMVFGMEGEGYDIRSWGEILRRAVRENDRATFDEYAASGVEQIMPFEEIRRRYAETMVEFVSGKVRFMLTDTAGATMADGRVRRYSSPDENIVQALGAKIIDPYAPDTVIAHAGRRALLRYQSMEKAGDDVVLRYQLI